MNNILIHVGKCSGTAIKNSLQYHKIHYNIVHHANKPNKKPVNPNDYLKNKKYQFIICIRHPIDRWISAFNYKYTRCIILKGNDNFKGEILGFKYFKNVEKLAENLYNKNGSLNIRAKNFCLNCDHLSYGLHHYLYNFNKNHNIKIIRHEYKQKDYKNIFGKNIFLKNKSYKANFISMIDSDYKKKNKIYISQKAYNNLKKFLKKDFDIIKKFEKYGLISKGYKNFCLNKLPKNIIIKKK